MATDKQQMVTVENVRNKRYGEIFVINQGGIEVYNTTGLNDCPAELWDALDLESIKKEHDALSVQKNGPHFWMMDWQTLSLGEKATFGGIDARWAARAPLSAVQKSGASGAEPYKVYTPEKIQKMRYDKGKPVYELVDPEGNAYVLQARNEELPMESLATLGNELKLPAGWKYRTRILTEDLVLDLGPAKTIYAVGDDFHQYYTRI
jgi:hypothetical protein